MIYPQDDVALAGSKKKFCCIIPYGTNISDFTYSGQSMQSMNHIDQTYIFDVTMEPSTSGGDELNCELNNGVGDGSTVFVTCKF